MYYFAHFPSLQTDKMSTLEEKYEDEGYRNLMKNFAASAASGDLAGLEKGLAEVNISLQGIIEVFISTAVSLSNPWKSQGQPIFSPLLFHSGILNIYYGLLTTDKTSS